MTDTVIIYATSMGGHVRETANYIAKALNADTFDLKKQTVINISEYKRVILGTAVHFGKPLGALVNFMEANKDQLAKKKSIILFICCMNKAEKGEAQCTAISKDLGIADATFFPDSGEKNEDGISKDVDAFIARLQA
ncbi:MAG: flavodoxin domain-containing protein [Candidatus Methanomethylophilus sp.]|nr:flavodoxin domain-containing protein [Methanomethylophilus sp.]